MAAARPRLIALFRLYSPACDDFWPWPLPRRSRRQRPAHNSMIWTGPIAASPHPTRFDIAGRHARHAGHRRVQPQELIEVPADPIRVAEPVLGARAGGHPVGDAADRRARGLKAAEHQYAEHAELLVLGNRRSVEGAVQQAVHNTVLGDAALAGRREIPGADPEQVDEDLR